MDHQQSKSIKVFRFLRIFLDFFVISFISLQFVGILCNFLGFICETDDQHGVFIKVDQNPSPPSPSSPLQCMAKCQLLMHSIIWNVITASGLVEYHHHFHWHHPPTSSVNSKPNFCLYSLVFIWVLQGDPKRL